MEELQTSPAELPPYIIIEKREGETPLECLEKLRIRQSEYKDAVLTYAGRLDPMAEGKLLVLINEENKNRDKYLGLDKEYEVEVLFGISTDTGDILGKVTSPSELVSSSLSPFDAGSRRESQKLLENYSEGLSKLSNETLQIFTGEFRQQYPHYSSRTVNGKPLFQWAREGRLGEIEIPEAVTYIYDIHLLNKFVISGEKLFEEVQNRIAKVKGDFRQEEILDSWKGTFTETNLQNQAFNLIRIRVSCSSGTYMRTLAEKIAQKIGTKGLAWRIRRTEIKLHNILA
jgi:tRNA U55 pseudouridine synthase TruB